MDSPPLRVLRADNPSAMTLDGTRTFVLGRRRALVVDPGPDERAHLQAIRDALGRAQTITIVVTHGHADHAAGAAPLGDLLGAPVMAIVDGETVETDVGSVRAFATPGHAPDHLAYHWTGGEAPGRGALFVGDLMMGVGDTTLVAPPEGDLGDYLRSLDRVEALAPSILYPAHGPPLEDPAEAVARYRRHRLARIEQVAELRLRHPEATAAELVDAVYGPTLLPALHGAAEDSIRAVLRYLEEEAKSEK